MVYPNTLATRRYYAKNKEKEIARTTRYRKLKPEQYAAYQRKYYRVYADWLDSIKDKPCMDCGNKFPPECMDFDHVRGEKSFNISHSKRRNKELVLAEIAKCDLVCANCHRIRTKQRG